MSLELVMVRHAKSLHDSYVDLDMERHLSARGYSDAAEAARWCKTQKLNPTLLVSSPAIRAFSTALIFANRYGYPPSDILLKGSVYEAGTLQLLYVIQELPAEHKSIFMFGHNPGFEETVRLLTGKGIGHFPTSGVARIQFDIVQWMEVEPGCGILKDIYART
jgi:phosphohistidine phosphatase